MNFFKAIPNGFTVFRFFAIFARSAKEIARAKENGDIELEKKLIADSTYAWSKKLADHYGVTFTLKGEENVPQNGGAVFIANHQGYGDIVVMFMALKGHQIGFIAKDNLKGVPYLGKWIKGIRGTFIKRGNAREALRSMSQGAEVLKQGFSLVIFPEGTRSQGPEMGEFKPGSFKLATKAKVPIVPVTISGTYKLFEENGYIKGGHVNVIIHEPIETAHLTREETARLVKNVENIVRGGLL